MRSGVCGAVSGRYIEIFTQLESGGGGYAAGHSISPTPGTSLTPPLHL